MDNTKSVQLTEDEVRVLIINHGSSVYNGKEYDITNSKHIERMKYLAKRLKDFNESIKDKIELKPKEAKLSW